MPRRFALLTLFAALLMAPPPAAAQGALTDLSLEELMGLDAGRVFGASERMQPVTEAPASVSFITAEEIDRQGYRTLADILRGVRGLYVSDDRNFSLVGARGFGKPGDYNSRILLLVNGHRVNDNVYGQAEIGAEFGLDPAMFERVEIIRGPASSLYGDSAFFAVVNVITKSGASLDGTKVTLEAGSQGTQLTRFSAGQRFGNGADAIFSATYETSDGVQKLYFPAFDTPATNNGIAEGLDGERLGQFYTRVSFGNFTFTGAYGRRRKDVPTASFGTVFNSRNPRETTTDRHTLADLEYVRLLNGTRLSLRASFDQFTYDGTYPVIPSEPESAPLETRNGVLGRRWSAGARLTRPIPGRQVLTAGTELINNVNQDQWVTYLDPAVPGFMSARSSVQSALYVQDEFRLSRWLMFNAGARYDHYEQFERVTPRAAIIVMPSAIQSVKYLYGGAFRAPNGYELNPYYFGDKQQSLRPESIDTHELVWERYTNEWLRTSVSGYWYTANRLISLAPDETTFLGTRFVNEGEVRAKGLEVEAQMRIRGGIQSVASYALQEARDVEAGLTLVNSPAQMGKFRLTVPCPLRGSSLGGELLLMSSRRTLRGDTIGATASLNLNLVTRISRSIEMLATVRNVFNGQFFDPASEQHVQDVLPQDGRTFRVGLRWSPFAR